VRVHLIQYDIAWNDPLQNLDTVSRILIARSLLENDWIILPEMWDTGFIMDPQTIDFDMQHRALAGLRSLSERNKVHICGSSAFNENGVFRNTFFHEHPSYSLSHYHKRYLYSPAGEHQQYDAGKEPTCWTVDDKIIRPFICYDLRFGPWSFEPHADVLIFVASWPKTRTEHWDALLKARAIENQSHVIGVNRIGTDANNLDYIGHSSVYAHDGSLIGRLGNEEGALSCIVDFNAQEMYRERLPFYRDRS